ncbi:MAG: lipopolysaccharide heptosyltransferase family protein [Rhodospirillales bacterium]|nr:lipopolysaccharide heptosyltransferase family protein [Rhodospirillales bacterium]
MMLKPFHLLDYLLGLKRRFRRRPGPANGVLLISAGGLGDTVLFSLLAVRFATLAREGEPVSVLLRNDARKMAFLLPGNMGLEIVNFSDLRKSISYRRKIAERLFNAHYRLIVATDQLRHPDLDEALIKMAAPEQAVAMEPRSWPKYDAALNTNRRLYSRLFDSGPDRLDKVVRWSAFANWLNGTETPPPKVHINIDMEESGGETPDILIQPFSAVAAKQSPVALYRALIEALPEGTSVALTGAPGDLDANPDYKQLLELPGVNFNSAGFEELVPALRAAKLVISVDTALMHLAVALGAPTICLASAAYVGEIVPYAAEITPENAHVIYQTMDCEGCLGKCHLEAVDGMYPCVAALDVNQVIALGKELLKP